MQVIGNIWEFHIRIWFQSSDFFVNIRNQILINQNLGAIMSVSFPKYFEQLMAGMCLNLHGIAKNYLDFGKKIFRFLYVYNQDFFSIWTYQTIWKWHADILSRYLQITWLIQITTVPVQNIINSISLIRIIALGRKSVQTQTISFRNSINPKTFLWI